MVADGALLEYAEFAGNFYGTPRAPVLKHLAKGVPTLLEIELQGARQVRQSMPDAQFVFLAPPSIEELVQRLSGRGTESPESVAARLGRAQIELAAEPEFDQVVINDDVDRAARRIAALLTEADA
jgi:guanylate kinase